MRTRLWLLNTLGLIRRERTEHYLLVILISFAASVCLTRLFLTVSGYTQAGGGELHIAHVLWGGLLLFIAALLPLILVNRRVYSLSAGLAGMGVGLFIDEVGKFITTRNDYFYPAAAPIIYIAFLVTLWVFYQIMRTPVYDTQSELSRALEDIQEMLHHPLDRAGRAFLEMRLQVITNSSQNDMHSTLAELLLQFIRFEGLPLKELQHSWFHRMGQNASKAINRGLTGRRMRIVLIIGLIGLALLAMKNPAFVFLSSRLPSSQAVQLLKIHFGRQVDATVSPGLFQMRMEFEIIVGLILLVAGGLLASGRIRGGIRLGYLGLLLAIT